MREKLVLSPIQINRMNHIIKWYGARGIKIDFQYAHRTVTERRGKVVKNDNLVLVDAGGRYRYYFWHNTKKVWWEIDVKGLYTWGRIS